MTEAPRQIQRPERLNKVMNAAVTQRTVIPILDFLKRHPGVLALIGFISGVASFILVKRGNNLAVVLSLMMLLSWIWLTLERHLRKGALQYFGVKVPRAALRYLNQVVHQESLFFVLPFFFITTTWNSGQVVFLVLVGTAALISVIDPWYYGWLASKRWLYFLFHGFTLFALSLVALPIIVHLPTSQSYQWSLLIATLVSIPGAAGNLPVVWKGRIVTAALLTVAIGGVTWLARPWVPPANLWLVRVAIVEHLDSRTTAPVNSIRALDAASLDEGLYAYTAIRAPRGLNERIYHVWYRDGQEVDRIPLEIEGGRAEGYRAWTHKVNFPPDATGKWKIQVQTEIGQIVGVLRFKVTQAGQKETRENNER
ncbi:MAG: DUF5924 family protein [Lysobacterales bacterium]